MTKRDANQAVRILEAHGFTTSTGYKAEGRWIVHVSCPRCEASVINGVACHEGGCERQMHECKGCNALVPRQIAYCADCQ